MARILTFDGAIRFGFYLGVASSCAPRSEDSQTNETKGTTAANTVNIRQPALHNNHPLASLFGKYDNEPLWDGFEETVKKMREDDHANSAVE